MEEVAEGIPAVSTLFIEDILHEDGELVTLFDVDFKAYRRANDNRSVRTNVTIPSWLKDRAEKEGIKFS